MADNSMNSSDYHILLALAGGEAHGYALIKTIADLSDGQVRLGPGTLYGSISRLLDRGLIEETDAPADGDEDARRRYYRLSQDGQVAVSAESARLARLVAAAHGRGLLPRGLAPAGLPLALGEASA